MEDEKICDFLFSFRYLGNFAFLFTCFPSDLMRRLLNVGISVVVSWILPNLLDLPDQATTCMFILLLTGIWWVSEPFPAYVTALAVVPLIVAFGIVSAKAAAAAFFDPTMFLFIAGFSIASAMEKHKLTQKISNPLVHFIVGHVHKAGGDAVFYFGLSALCVGLSAVVSNVAAAVLVTTIGQSLISDLHLDVKSQRRVYLTIAFACNIGGMVVPIASPQNIVAVAALRAVTRDVVNLDFFEWFFFAAPICALGIVAVYVVLRGKYGTTPFSYRHLEDVAEEGGESASPSERWTSEQLIVASLVTCVVIGWCFFNQLGLSTLFGHMGVFGLVPVVAMHAVGISSPVDWQNLPWAVLTLMGGGIALGEAVNLSGLLTIVSDTLTDALGSSGPWLALTAFLAIIGIVSNFLSSTVCALIATPIVAQVGNSMGHAKLFVLATSLMISAAMALPVSSFPNANSATNSVLSASDFARSGSLVAVVFFLMLATIGYVWGGVLAL